MAQSEHVVASESAKKQLARRNKKNKVKHIKQKPCYRKYKNGTVIYIGHLPHGFYEYELHHYFRQFGEVGRIQLCRSKKTHRSKGYAFIEFESKSDAEIAAESMNNYLMFQKLLKCHVVPDEKVNPNLFKHSRSSKYYILPHVKHRNNLRKPQTDETLKRSIKKIKSKRNKLKKKLSQLGISYDLVPLSKQAQDENAVERNNENLVPEKKQQLDSPQRKETNLLSNSPDSKMLNKTALKKKRQTSDSGSEAEEQLEPDVCSKKQKLCKKHKDLPESAKGKTPQKSDLQTSARKASLKVQRQASEGSKDNDDSGLPVKKQRLISPKMEKLTTDAKLMKSPGKGANVKKGPLGTPISGTNSTVKRSPLVMLRRIPERNKIQKKEKLLPYDVEITEREEIKEVAMSARKKKPSTPIPKNTSLINTPTTKETTPADSETPDGEKSVKKMTTDAKLMKSVRKGANVKKGPLGTPKSGTNSTVKRSPLVMLRRISDSINSSNKIQKKKLVQDVEKNEDDTDHSTPEQSRKITTEKNKKSPSLRTHVTTGSKRSNTKEVQNTATKFEKQLSEETSVFPDQSTPSTRVMRSGKKTNAKISLKQDKQADVEDHEKLDNASLTAKTPKTTLRCKQSVSTPSTRVMRSSRETGAESPLLDAKTPTKVSSTPKHKSCSVKKEV